MKTITVQGFAYEIRYGWEDKLRYAFYEDDYYGGSNTFLIGPCELTINIPDTFNPTAQQIAALQAKETELRNELNEKINAIRERISKLQALEYVEAA